jgi:DNA-binding beta-propeller fold protein YncE
MRRLIRGVLFLSLIAASVTAASNQFVARYVPIGTSGSADLLAVDASGNFFIVANVQESSGRPQIRAIKTDPQGNEIASFDFGGSSDTSPDAPSGAAVDPQGNLVIVGTTSSTDSRLSHR